MRVLVVSDIHGNLAALDAVLADADDFDVVWSLGDVVGYGPQPNECIARLNAYEHKAIAGNHDWGALGKLDLEDFNIDARRSNLWTREVLAPQSWSYLDALPQVLVEGEWTLAHGSPRYPIWEYLIYSSVAKQSFGHFETPFCLVGHTHVPVIFRDIPDRRDCVAMQPEERSPLPLTEGRYIVNPGSVGQPRDGDPRAAYLLLDVASPNNVATIEHRRVSYDVADTQRRIRVAGLPTRNSARLELGW